MMGGYDRRVNYGNPVNTVVVRSDDGVPRRGSFFQKKEEVVSYRDNPSGAFVAPYTIDPYGFFLSEEQARKRKMAALSGALGNEKPQVVDNGHPYSVVKRRFYTSHVKDSYVIHPGSSNSLTTVGGPLWAYGLRLTPLAVARAPFQPQVGTGDGVRTIGPDIPASSLDELLAFGRKAVVDRAPARPRTNLFGMVGELLQGIPHAPFTSLGKWQGYARKGADEFLNYVFGVQPTIRDISSLVAALTHVSDQLLQYQKDSGAGVRRTMSVPVQRTHVEFSGTDLETRGRVVQGVAPWSYGTLQGTSYQPYSGSTSDTLQISEVKAFRFAGSFTYYLPGMNSFEKNVAHYVALADKLVSVRPTSEVIWNLIPFSWLVDWFIDVSDALRAAEVIGDDGLVLNYGYCSLDLTRRVRQNTRITGGPDKSDIPVHTSVELRQKTRLRANPFGFLEANSAEWTPVRFAILGAMGITRSPRY